MASNFGKQVLRTAKNYTKGYSEAQTKVRSATSNDPWGPTGTQMNEIAMMTYNQQDFIEIMEMMDKRLNDKGKNWRHVFKTLVLLDYILHAGSENVVMYFKENAYIIKTLKEFQYVDEYGKDQGANVRQKAKDISNLLLDDARLKEQRKSRAHMQGRMLGRETDGAGDSFDIDYTRRPKSTPADAGRSRRGDDPDLQKALDASRKSAASEAARAKDDADLAEAIRLSKEEDEKRKKLLAQGGSLFDDHGNPISQESASDSLIDFSMPAQNTGYAPQFASFNPYAQYQQQQEEYLRMQQLEAQRQAEEQAAYQQLLLQQQQQQQQADFEAQQRALQEQAYQQAFLQQQQQQAELQRQQQQQLAFLQAQQTAQPLIPQHTNYGSNNPFAAFGSTTSSPPPMPSPQISQQPVQQPTFASSPSPQPPIPTSQSSIPKVKQRDDGDFAKLAALLGNREDGVDTFGNIGNLRVPVGAQFHPSNRLVSQSTGATTGSSLFGTTSSSSSFGQQQSQSHDPNPFFTI